MSVTKLTHLCPAPAGYYLLGFKSVKEGDTHKLEFSKQPVLLWGCSPEYPDPVPVTPEGAVEDCYSLLLPDGSVFESYADVNWYANEAEWRNMVSAEVTA